MLASHPHLIIIIIIIITLLLLPVPLLLSLLRHFLSLYRQRTSEYHILLYV